MARPILPAMRRRATLLLLAMLAAPGAASRPAHAQAQEGAHVGDRPGKVLEIGGGLPPHDPSAHLRVGICDMPPWSMPPVADSKEWSGLAAILWRRTVLALKLDYSMQVYDYKDLLAALERGEIDVAVTGIPIVPEHLVRFSLTPAFDESGISIATEVHDTLSMHGIAKRLLDAEVLTWMAALLGFAAVFSAGFWLAERRRNPNIEGPALPALGESTWWSLVTLSTVGYGDRVPVTGIGKLVAALWMAVGFVLMTITAAVVTSVLTVARLQPAVSGPADLARVKVGVVDGTTAQEYADTARIPARRFETIEAAMDALEAGEIRAVVGSTTSLRYLTERRKHRSITVLPSPLLRDYVAFGTRFGLDPALEKRIELEVVKGAQTGEYRNFRAAMLGGMDAVAGSPDGGQ